MQYYMPPACMVWLLSAAAVHTAFAQAADNPRTIAQNSDARELCLSRPSVTKFARMNVRDMLATSLRDRCLPAIPKLWALRARVSLTPSRHTFRHLNAPDCLLRLR